MHTSRRSKPALRHRFFISFVIRSTPKVNCLRQFSQRLSPFLCVEQGHMKLGMPLLDLYRCLLGSAIRFVF
jgi:hypothetical protein